jgi:FkbM family methyltransferase
MLGIGRFKTLTRGIIGTHRRSPVVKALHGFASFVESAYANEGASFERNGEQALLNKLRGFDFGTAFDVVANFGDWTSEAIAVWPKCHVHAFEVAPGTFDRLSERFRSFQQPDRLTLNCLGLSDEEGSHRMYYYPEHPELTCESPRHDYPAVPFDANLAVGDEYCDSRGIDTVDFLKIDVEGAEFRVLRGFAERIAARKIHCIQFEYGAFATQTRFLLGDYYSLLSSAYWIGKIYPGCVEFLDYDWTIEDFRFSNYCCVSRLRPDIRAILAG